METAYLVPTVATLLFGGWLYTQGQVSLGDVTTATLYVQMLIDPVDRIVSILDELQLGAASLARLLGVAQVPDDREASGREPGGEQLEASDVRFSYVEGRDVLHGVDLVVGVGERIAMVGPSGAGKSTLGRLLAGIHPPRTGVGHRRRRGADRAAAGRPARPRRAGDPGAPRLRRHASARTSRWPAPAPPTTTVRAALDGVDALEWVDALPDGLDTVVGSGGRAADARPRPSRSRSPGWCWPTRTRWCSTRPPR